MTIQEMIEKKKELGYTNETLAKISGVPLGTVQKIFAGITRAPRRSTIIALEAVLSGEEKKTGTEYSYSYENDSKADVVRESARAYGAAAVAESPDDVNKVPYPGAPGDPAQGTYTLDDYYALPNDRRVELIDGVLYDMGAPSMTHQTIVCELLVQFYNCLNSHKSNCTVMVSPCDVRLDMDDQTIVQPDLFVFCQDAPKDDRYYPGAPDLVIEILSPSSRQHDMILKYKKYMEAGVREYWIVDPENLRVIVYYFKENDLPTLYTFEDTIPVKISNGECSVDFNKILPAIQRYL